MPVLNYNRVRYFRAVAHDNSLTGAARALNLSQSTLSVQSRTLEERLGLPLFDRVGRTLRLTEAGRVALDHADAIFKTGEERLSTLNQTSRTRRVLRIGALATLSRNFKMAFLEPQIGRADIEVILRSASQGRVDAGSFHPVADVVLTTHAPPRDTATPFLAHSIAEELASPVGRPHRIRPGDTLHNLVAREPLFLPTLETSLRTAFDAPAAREDLNPQIAAGRSTTSR